MKKDPARNRAHQKAFYDRLRKDPVRWRAYLDHKAAYKRRVRLGEVASKPKQRLAGAEWTEAIIRGLAAISCVGSTVPQPGHSSPGARA